MTKEVYPAETALCYIPYVGKLDEQERLYMQLTDAICVHNFPAEEVEKAWDYANGIESGCHNRTMAIIVSLDDLPKLLAAPKPRKGLKLFVKVEDNFVKLEVN